VFLALFPLSPSFKQKKQQLARVPNPDVPSSTFCCGRKLRLRRCHSRSNNLRVRPRGKQTLRKTSGARADLVFAAGARCSLRDGLGEAPVFLSQGFLQLAHMRL